jgi:prepilin-type N-terminal cleavage/methylation domain-containing protein
MRHWRGNTEAGFTLVEILVAVAILAILSATLSPLVIKYVNDGRRARALSDSQTIGQAILAFQVDTGLWPVSDDGTLTDAGELSRLVGLPAAEISNANIPGGSGGSTGAWQSGGAGGTAGALEDHLIFNQDADTNPLYPTSATPPDPPGWNGPYLKSVPQDPWGNPFVCNVRYLTNANVGGVTTAEAARHAVMCLSAGPNLVWDTAFADPTALDGPAGDDLGFAIQGNQTRP